MGQWSPDIGAGGDTNTLIWMLSMVTISIKRLPVR